MVTIKVMTSTLNSIYYDCNDIYVKSHPFKDEYSLMAHHRSPLSYIIKIGFSPLYIQFHLLLCYCVSSIFFFDPNLIATEHFEYIAPYVGEIMNLLIPLKNSFCTMC